MSGRAGGAPQVPVSHHCQHWRWHFPCLTLCAQSQREMTPPHKDPAGGSTGIPSIHSSLQVQLELFCPWNSRWKGPGRFQSPTAPCSQTDPSFQFLLLCSCFGAQAPRLGCPWNCILQGLLSRAGAAGQALLYLLGSCF